jgi:hypothetical protein
MKATESRLAIWLVAFCLLPFFADACGLKAPPRAPQDVLPQRINDLRYGDAPDGIELSWSRPRLYADGSRMTDLGGFSVERAPAADPSARFQRISVLPVTDRDRFRQLKAFHYVDRDSEVGTEYRYRVVSFTLDGYFSAPSNVVAAERKSKGEENHAPLPPPRG